MTFLIPSFLLGMLVSYLIWRPERKRLIFNNEMLLDFNEKMIREREELEEQIKVQRVVVGLSDDTPIYEGDEVEI